MRKAHLIVAAILIGIAAGLGTYAVTRTSELGVKARTSSDKAVNASIAARTRRLDALKTSLRKALARKPPALPPLPKVQPHSSAPPQVVAAAPRYTAGAVTVIRPAGPTPSRGERESERGSSGGEQDD